MKMTGNHALQFCIHPLIKDQEETGSRRTQKEPSTKATDVAKEELSGKREKKGGPGRRTLLRNHSTKKKENLVCNAGKSLSGLWGGVGGPWGGEGA